MPNIADIMEIAEVLETKAILEIPERCVSVRNRNAKCRRCLDACVADAISVGNNKLVVNNKLCVACGACTTMCPTEALMPLRPTDASLHEAAVNSFHEAGAAHASKSGGPKVLPGAAGRDESQAAASAAGLPALIGCARIAARRIADPHLFAEVPCMARVDVSTLLDIVAAGAPHVLLVDGDCSTCKYHATSEGVDAVVQAANDCLVAMGSEAQVQRVQEFPQHAQLADKHSLLGESRRGFFTSARSWTASAAGKTAQHVVEKNLGVAVKPKSMREKLGAKGGSLPQFEPERRITLLNAMDSLGSPVEGSVLDTPLFGSVEINTEKCNSCGMCTVFCPTGALKKSDVKPAEGDGIAPVDEEGNLVPGNYLEFSAADCVQCNLCADACMKKCLTVKTQVSITQIFDFEPQLLFTPKPKARPGLIGNRRSALGKA